MPKMMSPKTTIWWVTDATYDPDNPQAALLTDARNVSCAIETGYSLGPTDSDTDDSSTICDTANVSTAVAYNYEGSLTFFREGDPADTTSAFARAFSFFKNGTQNGLVEGYLVRRVGYVNTVAAAAGQEVESFKFIPDNPVDVVEDKAPIRFTVPFKQQGKMSLFEALV